MATNVEADPMFQLLSEALRAGPGSPEWRQAVGQLRDGAGSSDHAGEYRLLIQAREHLESGREYRSVRAGAGFTRKVLIGIDEASGERAARRGLPMATIVATLAALSIFAVLVIIGYQLLPASRPPPEGGDPVKALAKAFSPQSSLPTEVASAEFMTPPGAATMPSGWERVGQLPLTTGRNGLRPVLEPAPAGDDGGSGGAALAPISIPPDQPFAAEARLTLERPSEDVVLEFFASADPTFSADRAQSGNEIVWVLSGDRQSVVLVSDNVPRPLTTAPAPARGKAGKGEATIRILLDKEAAIVEVNGERIWAGAHALPAQPRRVGVRFLRAPARADLHEPAVVQAVKILRK